MRTTYMLRFMATAALLAVTPTGNGASARPHEGRGSRDPVATRSIRRRAAAGKADSRVRATQRVDAATGRARLVASVVAPATTLTNLWIMQPRRGEARPETAPATDGR
ncbi:MAG TPA: hypothetical protein VFH51_06520 [Myxococcota bacterium]|nr:hypothetical protein [Myxococcota bacterium]